MLDDFATISDIAMRPVWQRRAACRGKGTRECFAFAIASPELVGIWAGTDERERRRLRRASA